MISGGYNNSFNNCRAIAVDKKEEEEEEEEEEVRR